MNKIRNIIQRDLRHILRDKSIMMIFFIPIIFWILLRFLPPIYEPLVPIMKDYRMHILAVFCILSSVLLGFVISFIILEEKDEHLIPLFSILPVPIQQFTIIRTLLIMCLGFVSSVLIISTTGLVQISFSRIFMLSFICSTTGPAITFLITAIASNKIEGVTLFKLLSFITIIPIAGLFMTSKLSLCFGILPYYWIYSVFAGNVFISMKITFLIATLYNVLFVLFSYKLFIYRVNR